MEKYSIRPHFPVLTGSGASTGKEFCVFEGVNFDVYEGEFVTGKRQGEGTIRYASGEVSSGTWENGALVQAADN